MGVCDVTPGLPLALTPGLPLCLGREPKARVATSVNIIIKNLKTKLGLPKSRPTPYHLRMADQSMTIIIKKFKIHLHGIPYITTFIVMKTMC